MAGVTKEVAKIDNYSNTRDFPRSPASISPDPSRIGPLRPLRSDDKSPEPNTPDFPPMRLTRKRAASLNTEAANIVASENLILNSARPTEGGPHTGQREQVCLCQPDPKIPRPRNGNSQSLFSLLSISARLRLFTMLCSVHVFVLPAPMSPDIVDGFANFLLSFFVAFILYRQHYQAQVVAQHPGLANPEISKIIGEQWRDQNIEVKNEWKRLAEVCVAHITSDAAFLTDFTQQEEKQRHQRQYPDYRYQPRRAGKANARPISSSPSDDPGRCPKCGGRYISTPSTPLSSFPPQYQAHDPHSVTNNSQSLMQSHYGRPTTPNHEQVYRQRDSPRAVPPYASMRGHRTQYSGHAPSSVQLGSLRDRDSDMESASPDFKRRRYNDNVAPQSSPRNYLPQSPYAQPQDPRRMVVANNRPLVVQGGWVEDRRPGIPLPSPGQLIQQQHTHSGNMEPPPRPAPLIQSYPQHPVHVPTPRPNVPSPVFDESLRLPPLQTSLSISGASLNPPQSHQESQARSVEAMVMTIPYINKIKVLSKISPCLSTLSATSSVQEVRGAVVAIEGSDPYIVGEVGRYIQEYLAKEPEIALRVWTDDSIEPRKPKLIHQNSDDMTSPTGSHSSDLSNSFINANESFKKYLNTILSWHTKSVDIQRFITTNPQPEGHTPGMPISPSTTVASIPSPDPATITPPIPATSSAILPRNNTPPPAKVPVALLPLGFSLSTSDHYASRIPINDAYAPVDHWQWTATLWRGIIGPDLTIYIASPGAGGKDDGSTTAAGAGVEVRNDCSAIVVKSEDGRGVEEKCLRRLGFEVLEFVRGFGAGDTM